MNNIESPSNNTNILDPHRKKSRVIVLKSESVGDITNERIKTCCICKDNGWSHDAITFERVLGKVLSGGRNEPKGWIIRDYSTGQVHSHRSNKQKECEF